ncbi:MAG: DUF4834 family protein [Prevotellaceae bacterium]|jgi:uncharacterized protein (UPF0333 family)|nr:DUF4834 family protein [Prevotellaceae bacterium]
MYILLLFIFALIIIIFAINTVFYFISKVIGKVGAIFRADKRFAQNNDTNSKRNNSSDQNEKIFDKTEGEYVDFEEVK